MRDVRVPSPNPALAQILLGAPMRSLVSGRAELAQALYREIVAKRTRTLAGSARVVTFASGGRWRARLVIGEGGAEYYGTWHEFGRDDGDETVVAGAHDLRAVLAALGQLP